MLPPYIYIYIFFFVNGFYSPHVYVKRPLQFHVFVKILAVQFSAADTPTPIQVVFSVIFIAEYKGKLGHCDLDTINATGLEFLQREFGLTDGIIYYDFVRIGADRATQPCNVSEADGLISANALPDLPLEEQASGCWPVFGLDSF